MRSSSAFGSLILIYSVAAWSGVERSNPNLGGLFGLLELIECLFWGSLVSFVIIDLGQHDLYFPYP